jgi:hypothetical protein
MAHGMGHARGLRERLLEATRPARSRLLVLAVVGAIAVLSAPANGLPADPPQLNAKFNTSLTFSMTTSDGSPLGSSSPPGRVIPAGYYAVNVDDTAEIGYMTFLLQGPGVALRTTNDEGASAILTFFVTLQPSATYSYSDAVNPQLPPLYFSTSATVGSTQAGSSSTTTTVTGGSTPNSGSPVGSKATKSAAPSTTSSVFRGTLRATVGASGHVSLTFGGKNVSSLKVGRYKVAVTDESRQGGFTIQEAGLSPTTVSAVSFVGTRSATLSLGIGQWFFYPSALGKKTYFFVVR